MIPIRVALFITALLGAVYALIGLFSTLNDVGVGMAVAAAGIVGWGLMDWLEEHR